MRYLWEKFKQKKDMQIHVLKLHGVNMSKAMFENFDEDETFSCDMCDAMFKYKKGLNEHIRLKHEGTSGTQSFKCEICSLTYNQEKNQRAHKNLKHGS